MAELFIPNSKEAAKRLSGLLSALSITTVISVDDSHALGSYEGTANEVTEELVSSPGLLNVVLESLDDIDDDLEFNLVDPEDTPAISDFIVQNWNEFTSVTRTELLTAARTRHSDREASLENNAAVDDLTAPKRLEDIVGSSATFKAVSLAEWRTNWRELVAGSEQVLVLMDRSFAHEEGGDETTGENLLSDLLRQDLEHVRAGLLTSSATSEEEEIRITDVLRKKHQEHAHRIVAIGKFRLTDPAEFPAAIRMLLLVDETAEYRELAMEAFLKAQKAVEAHLKGLHDYTLIGAIAAAQQEGAFEFEHPLRLAQQVYEQELTSAVRDSEISSRILPRFREGSVGLFVNASSAGKQIKDVLRADIFVAGDHINELGLPIVVGDIFRLESLYPDTSSRQKGAARFFILLAQACDLSIRKNGERSNNLDRVLLQRLDPIDENELSTILNGQTVDEQKIRGLMKKSERLHVLGELEETSSQKWGVNFAQSLVVPTIALDATVFNRDGFALIEDGPEESRLMATGWLNRQKKIMKLARRMIKDFSAAETAMTKVSGKDELLLRLGASLATASFDQNGGVTALIDPSSKSVRYGLQRFGRVRPHVAVNIASLASTYNSRPAFEAVPVAESVN